MFHSVMMIHIILGLQWVCKGHICM